MNLHLVDESGLQALLARTRAAHHQDVAGTGRRLRLIDGALDPVQDKVEPSISLGKSLRLVMGKHEPRELGGRLAAPHIQAVFDLSRAPAAAASYALPLLGALPIRVGCFVEQPGMQGLAAVT